MARGREDRALCFRDLRDVTMAVSVLFVVLSLAGIVMSIVVWTELLPATTAYVERHNDPAESGYDSEYLVSGTAAAVLVVSIVGLLLSALLLHAARHAVKRLVLPWLVFYGLLLVLLSVLAVIWLVMACISGVWSGIVGGIVGICGALVFWSWFAAVWAHYYTM